MAYINPRTASYGATYGGYDPSSYGFLAGDQYDPNAYSQGASPSIPLPRDYPPMDQSLVSDPGRQKTQPVPIYQPPNPSAPPAATGSTADQISQIYQQDLGRKAGYYSNGNVDAGDTWQNWMSMSPDAAAAAIAASPEAQAYKQQGQNSQGLLLDSVLQRLKMLQQPISDPYGDAYAKQALTRVDQLNGAPFTDQQSAALLTKNMEPLTRARDQAKQQAAQDLSRRGFGPSSGVFQDRMKSIDAAYQTGTAGVTNSLNIQGITQAQQNAQQQLQILDSLVQMGRMSRQEADQRSQQIVQTAGIPFSTDTSLLGSLNSAAGGDQSSALINALMNLGSLNTRGTQIANQNSQDSSQALGAFLSYLLQSHALGF